MCFEDAGRRGKLVKRLVAKRIFKYYPVYAEKKVAKKKKFGCTISESVIMESYKLLSK